MKSGPSFCELTDHQGLEFLRHSNGPGGICAYFDRLAAHFLLPLIVPKFIMTQHQLMGRTVGDDRQHFGGTAVALAKF